MSEALLPVAIILGFAVVFPLFWCGVVMLIGAISGWTGLGRTYSTPESVAGWSIPWLRMRASARYSGVASLDAGPAGLGMRVNGVFRAGHPTLRIPWDAVRFEGEHRGVFGSTVRLELGLDRIPLVLPTAAWQQVEAAAPAEWIRGRGEGRPAG